MKKKNLKYFAIFLVSLVLVSGAYMLANSLMFYPIWAIYQIISMLTVCIYIYLYMNNEKKTEKERSEFSEKEVAERQNLRKNKIKMFVSVFLPFLVTILCDYTYLLLLSEQDWFISLMNIFK